MTLEDLDHKSRIFLENFRKNCAFLIGKKICIYGTGAYTGHIINFFPEFNVVALTDRDIALIGGKKYGLPIISLEEAIDRTEAILIVSITEFYWGIIYDRIKGQITGKIDVYYPDGTQPKLNDFIKDDPYWNKDFNDAVRQIDNVDVVSFDVFDTLVMRKYALPQDVFTGMERMTGVMNGFERLRRKAEEVSFWKYGNRSTLDTIYNEFALLAGVDDKKAEGLKQLEIEMELDIVNPRKKVVELFEYAKEHGKDVYLLTDMYHSSTTIEWMLNRCGIVGYDHLWVSCEKGCSKREGTLWKDFISEIGNRRSLHIGDDLEADIESAKKYGISTYHIRSAYHLMLSSDMKGMISDVRDFNGGVLLGNILLKYYNDPFSLKKPSNGELYIKRYEDLGYMAFGGGDVFLSQVAHRRNN